MIGTGYVGLVSGTCFAEIGHHVICCDIDPVKIQKITNGEIPIYEPGLSELVLKNVRADKLSFTTNIESAIQASDIIYIAVGTPMAANGEANLTYVENVAKTIGQNLNRYKIIVNKSTVPVGTGKWVKSVIQANVIDPQVTFDIASNPEFLREGSAIYDFMHMERAVIGSDNIEAATAIAELHEPLHTHILLTDIESSEMIKYAANGFLATKISFINAIANICERVGANVEQVSIGMGLDSRIGSKFLQAGIGYGGSCFPKDTHALLHTANKYGYDFDLMKSVIATNDDQRLIVVQKAKDILGPLHGKTIAVLGLAFKVHTDDMRDAPSVDIIRELSQQGATIRAYDPIALGHAQAIIGDQAQYYTDAYEAATGCDVCMILTDWPQITQLDLMKLKSLMKSAIMIDGRNCMSRESLIEHGFSYYSIGQPPIHSNQRKGGLTT